MALKPAIHGRDHCPGGADPIPCLGANYFRAVFWSSHPAADPIDVSSSLVDIPYTDWENSNTSIFAPKTSLGANPEMGTDLTQQVQLLANGAYTISWGVYFTTDFDASVAQYIHDGDPIFGRPEQTIHGPSTYGGNTFSTRGYRVQTISRIYTLLDPFDSGSWTPTISTDASQNSGTTKTVTEAWLEIHYQPANIP